MILRNFVLADFETIVDMYYEYTKEVFTERTVNSKYFFYRDVMNWVNTGKSVVVACDDSGNIIGFTMAYIDENGGMTNPVYNATIQYVVPEHRKTRVSYTLGKNMYDRANELKLSLVVTARVDNGVNNMVNRFSDFKEQSINLERKYNER